MSVITFSFLSFFTLTVPLSPTRCINGNQQIVGVNHTKLWEVTCDGLVSHVAILLVASYYGNRRQATALGSDIPLLLKVLNIGA